MNVPQYKIDRTGSSWSFERYGAYKRYSFMGISFWWKLYVGSDIDGCQKFLSDTMKLPIYIPELTK